MIGITVHIISRHYIIPYIKKNVAYNDQCIQIFLNHFLKFGHIFIYYAHSAIFMYLASHTYVGLLVNQYVSYAQSLSNILSTCISKFKLEHKKMLDQFCYKIICLSRLTIYNLCEYQ